MRVGLIGYCCTTGLGSLARALWGTGRFSAYAAIRHPVLGAPDPPAGAAVFGARDAEAPDWLACHCDAVVFAERPYLEVPGWLRRWRSGGRLACLIPMWEWLPGLGGWIHEPDAVWAPCRLALDVLARYARAADLAGQPVAWRDAILGGRWGVDLASFPFRQRDRAARFVFANGRGGCGLRKGCDVVAVASRMAADVPLRVYSQVPVRGRFGPLADVRVEELPAPADLYAAGDVLLMPSRWEGLGLPALEARASGMPVIATDAPPMNEGCLLATVGVAERRPQNLAGTPFLAVEPSAAALAIAMRAWLGRDISAASRAARDAAEAAHDLRSVAADLLAALAALA